MGFIAWIVVGAIAGFLANQIMGSREGLLMMVVLGIVGGLVGGFVATSVLKIGRRRHQPREHLHRHARRDRGDLSGEARPRFAWPQPDLSGPRPSGNIDLD